MMSADNEYDDVPPADDRKVEDPVLHGQMMEIAHLELELQKHDLSKHKQLFDEKKFSVEVASARNSAIAHQFDATTNHRMELLSMSSVILVRNMTDYKPSSVQVMRSEERRVGKECR